MSPTPQWIFEPFRVDLANACLWRGDQIIPLRPKVFEVLAHLVAHAGQLVTKESLFEAVWPETAVSDTVLKAWVREVRRGLGDMIQTPQFIAKVFINRSGDIGQQSFPIHVSASPHVFHRKAAWSMGDEEAEGKPKSE
jgi:hypothetical protein